MQHGYSIASITKNGGLSSLARRLFSRTKNLLEDRKISRAIPLAARDYVLPLVAARKPPSIRHPVFHKLARSRSEREAAFRLVYSSYRQAGLCTENHFGIRICPFQLLPDSESFISVSGQEIVATVSLIPDSANGLPMDSLYPEQVDAARRKGLYIGEISCLADRRKDHRRVFQNLCELTRVMTHFALQQKLDGLMLVSHPKHARFYKRFMGFESIGEIRSYRNVCDKLAEPLYFDFSSRRKAQAETLKRVLGEDMPGEELIPSQMNDADLVYFSGLRRAVEQTTPPTSTNSPGIDIRQPAVSPCH